MRNYLQSITPDSFTGMIFALEGISRSVVLINGSTGCKFYHSSTSDNQTIKQFEFDPLNYPEKLYFGQPRVPCTYLDSKDYIYGSKEKLNEALAFLNDNASYELLCVVNSPGAALIGDDLKGIVGQAMKDKPFVVIETPGFSKDICSGYETAALELIKQIGGFHTEDKLTEEKLTGDKLTKKKLTGDKLTENKLTKEKLTEDKQTHTVNLLGLSIFHRNHVGDIAELTRLLRLCGIEVNCVLCADCSVDSIRKLPSAALNIVIHPEYGMKTAQVLQQQFGTPFYSCDGPPIGFSATEKMIREVCELLGSDSTNFMVESEKARARAYSFISRVNSMTGLPKGVNFTVEGTYSELYAYTNFIVRYYSMILKCASVLNENSNSYQSNYQQLLAELGMSDALSRDILDTDSELVFGSGNTIAKLKLQKHEFSGIEISLPSLGYVDVIPKTHLGLQGALMLTEQILNGLMF